MLDEAAMRRPGFTEGTRVVLGDGREWALPRPRLVFYPSPGEGGAFHTRMRLTYGREYDPMLAAAFAPAAEGDEEAAVAAQMSLAATLICSNYDVPAEDLVDLLAINPEDPASLAWWSALNDAVYSQVVLPAPDPADAE